MGRFFYRFLKFVSLVTLIGLVLFAPAYAQGTLSQDEQNSIYNDTVWYQPDQGNGVPGSGGICTVGSLPTTVPAPYNSIFTAAGTKTGVSPALIAAIFYAGEHGSSWPNPPVPYGTGSAWASSGVPSPGQPDWPTRPPGPGAAGPFQFEYPTWQSNGMDGNGDGLTDVEDLTDAAFGAGKYLGASGASNTTNEQSIRKAIYAYNNDTGYVNAVWGAYVSFSTGGQSSAGSLDCPPPGGVSANGFANPFPGGWIPNRLDMGYDGTFKGQIVAPFAGTITYAANSFSNWGGYLELKASQQPNGLPTSTLYFAEGIAPAVKAGQQVKAGDPIANPAPSPYGNAYNTTPDGSGQIEWGVAVDGPVGRPTDPLAESGVSNPKQMVLNFASWAEQTLGLPPPSNSSNAGYP